MIIKRVKHRGFVVVDNKLARDRKISLKAKGLMLYLLSLPDNWEIRVSVLKNQLKEGRDSINNGIIELVKRGYMRKISYRKENGQFDVEYHVTEFPEDFDQGGKPVTDKPIRSNRNGSAVSENPKQSNKEEEKKEKEISSSTLSDITLELKEIGLSGNEINELIKEIDDDDKLNIVFEKIELIKIMISTGTVKNPVAYSIKTIKNINYNKPDILKKVEAEKRTQRDKKRKAEKLARIKEQKQYEQDLAMTEAEIPKMRKVIDERLSKFKKPKKAAGGM